MRRVYRDHIDILEQVDLARCYRLCGVSTHRDVLILWDEDFDVRVLTLVDELSAAARQVLLAVHEHEGSVQFFWRTGLPGAYANSDPEVEGDVWSAEHICRGADDTRT